MHEVDKYKSIKARDSVNLCLSELLGNRKFFDELIQNNRLTQEDLRYLLNKIDNANELWRLCEYSTLLIKEILNEFILNKEDVDKFNTLVENSWYKDENIHTIFDLIEYHKKYDKEILELIDLNKYIYNFELNEDQKLEVAVLIVDNAIARNKLIQIVENHLETNYDFDSLLAYLKKQEKKSILNI